MDILENQPASIDLVSYRIVSCRIVLYCIPNIILCTRTLLSAPIILEPTHISACQSIDFLSMLAHESRSNSDYSKLCPAISG